MGILANLPAIIIPQFIRASLSNHNIVHLKLNCVTCQLYLSKGGEQK